VTTYRYLTAAEWGGTWTRPPVREQPLDPECYIHHTAGNPMSDRTAEVALQTLNAYAQTHKGYSFLDYDYLVHYENARDLFTIAEGRGEWMSGATRDRNELGEAICLFGYFHPGSVHSQHPTAGHLEATALGIVHMIECGLLAPDAVILGHYENPAHPGATGCPGAYFIPHLPTIRQRVVALLTPPPDEVDDMLVIRVDGFADQFLCIPIDTPSARRKMDISDSQAPVIVQADRAAIEAQIPYDLTPLS
jgi:hypothetical protein